MIIWKFNLIGKYKYVLVYLNKETNDYSLNFDFKFQKYIHVEF